MNHTKHLHFLGASHDMVSWAEKHTTSFADLWEKCHRADWMLWIDRMTNLLDNHTRRLLACAFVRRTPLGDGGFVWDDADVAAKDAAWSAAWLAARAAERSAEGSPATSVEEAAQRDANRSAVWAATWSSAWDAAWDAARTAAREDAWEAAKAAALRASSEAQADIIRVIAGNPFIGAGHDHNWSKP
jgi:hypothetical protein